MLSWEEGVGPGGRPFAGPALDGVRHGPRNFWWANGKRMLEAWFVRGRPASTWRFWHMDGSYDPEMLSGERGESVEHVLDLDRDPPEWFGGEERAEAADQLPLLGLAELPELALSAGVEGTLARRLAEAPTRLFSSLPGEQEVARTVLFEHADEAPVALVNALNRLYANDEPPDAERLGGWGFALYRFLPFRLFFAPDEPGAAVESRRGLRRAYSVLSLTREEPAMHLLDVGSGAVGSELLWFPIDDAPWERMAPEVYAERFVESPRRLSSEVRWTEEPLALALGWLVAHQAEDGSWDGDEFMERCPEGHPCEGPASPDHDVGVTGLRALGLAGRREHARHGAASRLGAAGGHARGSWDPVGPWGFVGGRVYSTALLALMLEASFRYAR